MGRLKRAALLTRLMEWMREHGSWCGETHLQKAAFLAQELMEVPLELEFVLYRHGPYSFDLRDELTGLRGDGLVRLEPRGAWGPSFVATEHSAYIQGLYPPHAAAIRKQSDVRGGRAREQGGRCSGAADDSVLRAPA